VGWRTGSGGFGYPFEDGGAQIHAARTEWSTGQIWVRREFDLPDGVPQSPVLNIRYEGNVQVFLNGKKVFESAHSSPAYSNFDLAEVARGAFRPKGNVLAVRALASRRAPFRFLDFGLFDAGDHPVEPTVYGLSAPRIVTGPNGFEKWLIYRAYWNGVPGTGIDRVFFFDDEMVIDGPTTASTKGYHPLPVRPSFSDLFGPREDPAWTFSGSDWAVVDGVMRQTKAKGLFKAYLQGPPSSHYLFEANIRFPSDGKGAVGVVAYSDGKHDLVIGINPVERTWSYGLEPGNRAPNRFKLPEQFQLLEGPPGSDTGAAPLHLLRVTKNGGDFEVMLDEFKLTSKNPIATKLTGAGVPGLYCQDSAAEFDGVVYTMGWDEYDEYITGWGAAADGTSPGGEWKHLKEDGLKQMRHFGPGHIFKGDLLDQYEFTVNARTEGKPEESQKQLYGVFPVFIDQDNYLKAVIDIRNRELVVSGKRDGKGIGPFTRSLARRIPHRHLYDKSISYRDIAAWVYSLRSESRITALEIRWLEGEYDHLHQEFFVPTDEITIRHAKLPRGREPLLWDDGRFREADEPKPRLQESGILNPIDIRPVLGSHIGFGISITLASGSEDYLPDTLSRPQETLITVEVESSYFFRCVKLKDRVVIELNGHPMLEVAGEWPPSQVGLVTEGQPCFYNGIMLMHLPGE